MYNVGAVSHIPRTHSFIGAKYHFRLQWHWNYFECTVLVHMSAQHMDVKLKRKEKYTALLWSGAQNDRAVCFERTHSENAHFFYGYFISGSENWSMWRHAVVVGVVVVGAVFFFPLTLFMFAHSIQFDFHVHFIGAISRYTQLQLELIALLSRARVNSLYELSFLLKWTDNCYVSLHHPPPPSSFFPVSLHVLHFMNVFNCFSSAALDSFYWYSTSAIVITHSISIHYGEVKFPTNHYENQKIHTYFPMWIWNNYSIICELIVCYK